MLLPQYEKNTPFLCPLNPILIGWQYRKPYKAFLPNHKTIS